MTSCGAEQFTFRLRSRICPHCPRIIVRLTTEEFSLLGFELLYREVLASCDAKRESFVFDIIGDILQVKIDGFNKSTYFVTRRNAKLYSYIILLYCTPILPDFTGLPFCSPDKTNSGKRSTLPIREEQFGITPN